MTHLTAVGVDFNFNTSHWGRIFHGIVFFLYSHMYECEMFWELSLIILFARKIDDRTMKVIVQKKFCLNMIINLSYVIMFDMKKLAIRSVSSTNFEKKIDIFKNNYISVKIKSLIQS